MALRLRPVPLSALSAPPVTVTSPAVPSQAKLLPGSSLKVKVITAVSPDLSALRLLATATLGEAVSMAIRGVPAARPSLPAVSW